MLEYVYIKNKRNPLKVICSEAQGNLPDFTKTGYTAEGYEKDTKEAEKWEAYFYNETRYKDAYKKLFIQNFEVFCTHHKEILSRPEFANIRWMYPFWWCQYMAFNGTLGEALSFWLANPSYDGRTTLNRNTVVKMKQAYKSDKSVKPVHHCRAFNILEDI